MSDLSDRACVLHMTDKYNLELVICDNLYAVFKDIKLDLWYFGRINARFEPLRLYNGSKESVNEIFKTYIETGRIFWEILKDYG